MLRRHPSAKGAFEAAAEVNEMSCLAGGTGVGFDCVFHGEVLSLKAFRMTLIRIQNCSK